MMSQLIHNTMSTTNRIRKALPIVQGIQRLTVNGKTVYLKDAQARQVVELIKSFKTTIDKTAVDTNASPHLIT